MRLLGGGQGSGNFGHQGRPGEVGGSSKDYSDVEFGYRKRFISTDDSLDRALNQSRLNDDRFHQVENGVKYTDEQSDAVSRYTGSAYQYINDLLRGNENVLLNKDSKEFYATQAKHLMNSAIELPEDFIVYRGINSDVFIRKHFNEVLYDRGFTSTTVDPKVAMGFTTGSGVELDAIARIHLSKGTKVIVGSSYEKEFILMPNQGYKIINVNRVRYRNSSTKVGEILVYDLELLN